MRPRRRGGHSSLFCVWKARKSLLKSCHGGTISVEGKPWANPPTTKSTVGLLGGAPKTKSRITSRTIRCKYSATFTPQHKAKPRKDPETNLSCSYLFLLVEVSPPLRWEFTTSANWHFHVKHFGNKFKYACRHKKSLHQDMLCTNVLLSLIKNDKNSLKCQKRCLGFFGCRCNQINLLVFSLQYTLKLRQLVKLFSLNSNEFSLFFTKSKVTKTISFRPFVFSIQSCHANRMQIQCCQWFISPYVGKFPYPLLRWTTCHTPPVLCIQL